MRRALWITVLSAAVALSATAPATAKAPRPIGHVFVIVLENKNFDETFGPASEAPYLASTLPAKGQLLTEYYGTGHFSLGNYMTMVSGQSENPATQADCPVFTDFLRVSTDADGQAVGAGCVYPADVETVADQLEAAGSGGAATCRTWATTPPARRRPAAIPTIGEIDETEQATPADQYATRHNPFMYFHSIIDDAAGCAKHVVRLERLRRDLRKRRGPAPTRSSPPTSAPTATTRPAPIPAQPGGYAGIDAFLRKWVPKILALAGDAPRRPPVRHLRRVRVGAEACCLTPAGPNTLFQGHLRARRRANRRGRGLAADQARNRQRHPLQPLLVAEDDRGHLRPPPPRVRRRRRGRPVRPRRLRENRRTK